MGSSVTRHPIRKRGHYGFGLPIRGPIIALLIHHGLRLRFIQATRAGFQYAGTCRMEANGMLVLVHRRGS